MSAAAYYDACPLERSTLAKLMAVAGKRVPLASVPLTEVSLDETGTGPSGDRFKETRLARVPDSRPGPEALLLARARADELRAVVDRLPLTDRFVIVYRFGLDSGEPRTLEAVGEMAGVSRERIRQIEERALDHLRRLLGAPRSE